MAQGLLPVFSTKKCIKIAKRCVRLIQTVPGAESFIPALQENIKNTQNRLDLYEESIEQKDFYNDLILFKDVNLDNCVRDTADACKKYDRDNMGNETLSLIFPQNTTQIIETNYLKEPDEVKKAISRINNLGTDHPLQAQAEKLSSCIKESELAIKDYNDALNKMASCLVDVNMAKLNLIRTYNNTILDAKKKFGNKGADKLFPIVHVSPSVDENEDVTEKEEVSAAV